MVVERGEQVRWSKLAERRSIFNYGMLGGILFLDNNQEERLTRLKRTVLPYICSQ